MANIENQERNKLNPSNEDEIFDYIIIGSGFGGSVSAMRLTQKGYKVAVIESGKRWNADDFPKTNMTIKKHLWAPKIGCYGIQRANFLKHVVVVGGAGVGGGSLVYANTHYVPEDAFFEKTPVIKNLGGKNTFLPFYELGKKMLGVVTNPNTTPMDDFMKDTATDMGKGDTFTPVPVAVYFGKEDKTHPDPYFMGEGPERKGCNFCGNCMVGCKNNSKNTLDKNYLYFAEQLGAQVFPETKIVDINPLSADGSAGYFLSGESTTGWFGSPHRSFRAKNLVLSAGVLGSLGLLHKMKQNGRMPNISDTLGLNGRTNSEAVIGVTSRDKDVDFSKGLAITSSVHPDENTHIEPVRYGAGSDFPATMSTIMTDGGGRIPRWLRFYINIFRRPGDFIRSLKVRGYAQKSVMLLVMQTLDNSIKIVRKRRWVWPFIKSINTELAAGENIPTFIPIAHEFARRLGKKMNGMPQSSLLEVFFDQPTTAHVLGGACMAESPDEGVIDPENRLFGYPNILVCDGSMIPGNLGVNPSLSITAFTERAMSFIPPNPEGETKQLRFEEVWGVTNTVNGATNKVPV